MEFFSFAFKIKFGQTSESIRKIFCGFHKSKKFSIKKLYIDRHISMMNIVKVFQPISAIRPELNVVVVIKNSKFFSFSFSLLIKGIMLLNSPMLAAKPY